MGNCPGLTMTKIRALRQFSHYHAGSFDQFEVRVVKDEYAEALIGLELAEAVQEEGEQIAPSVAKKPGTKK